ncbi:MAG: S1/P1 nuclease [Chthoniobacteraceae bacterium]
MTLRATAALLALAATSHAWDLAGHMLVGEIAWQSSTPAVRERVTELVRDLDTTFSGGQRYNFVTAGAWLDDMRAQGRKYEWGKWHYVDIAKTDDGAAFALPEPPHVVWAIGESLKKLRDPKTPRAERVAALGTLMHCAGDIHQPLHACTWDDRGGNGYLLGGVAFADLYKGGRGNLHAFWDESYRVEARDGRIVETFITPPITSRPAPADGGVIATAAKQIAAEFSAEALAAESRVLDPVAWARESHVLGCTKAYPPGPHPGDNVVRTLAPEFATMAREIGARRVALAGYRLARVLEDLFGKP